MKTTYPEMALSSLLVRANRKESIRPEKTYRLLGARWYAEGLYIKDVKLGAQIRAKELYRVQANDFVYNRLFAWKGAFAIASKEQDACYVSNEFPCFTADLNIVVPEFLWWFFSRESAWDDAFQLSNGATPTSRNRLKEDKLLAMSVPMPPIAEQRRVLATIESIALRVSRATAIREHAAAEASQLYLSELATAMRPSQTWKAETLADVIIGMDAGWSPQCDDLPARGGRWGVLKTTSVQWCDFLPHENKALPPALQPQPKLAIEQGDVLVTRAGPRKRVGVVAAVRKAPPRLTISDKLIRLKANPEKVDPFFLELALASPLAQEHLVNRKTGLADAQVNISQAILRKTPVAYPSLSEQLRISQHLDDLRIKINTLRQFQETTRAEIEALMPSLLERAYSGRL